MIAKFFFALSLALLIAAAIVLIRYPQLVAAIFRPTTL